MTVTKEQFNLFYNVDRQLFTRLVVGLGREAFQSINVMAFLMWIEWISKDGNLVANILSHWSDIMLNNLADEVVVILNFLESSHCPNVYVHESNLPLIQHILRRNVTLKFFHEKRLEVINDITKFINDVCVRAFTDIIEQLNYHRAMKEQELYLANIHGAGVIPTHLHPEEFGVPQVNELGSSFNNAHENYDVSLLIKLDISEILNNLNLNDIFGVDTRIVAHVGNDGEKRRETRQLVDDRTIFMTFSKDCPVYENELREFFTRKFGNIIDNLIMQEANSPEQSMYARLVVRREAVDMVDRFLDDNPRMKFSINGKSVWVRKYIRKLPLAQPLQPAAPSRNFP
ncbi:hypothetical protein MTR_1g102760 [Medicago truncatula]|nr:hypothetical protein MTR_1g102760 [Medicago truncatula]